MPLEHEHDAVAVADAAVEQIGGCLRRKPADVAEGQHLLVAVLVAPLHGALLRRFCGNGIHHIVGKVEIVLIMQREFDQLAVFIKR